MHYLSAVAVFRDENRWLEEWLRFHHALGVEHFYLYNNDEDTTQSDRILRPYTESGLVDNIPWSGQFPQAYHNALENYTLETLWMAFLDLDEFIVPVREHSIPTVLEDYEGENGLAVHWNIFGSGNYIETPPNQINHFLHRAVDEHPANRYVKSIVKPEYVLCRLIDNPHLFPLSRGMTVDENWDEAEDAACSYTAKRIRIAHYAVRSRQYFNETMAKQRSPVDAGLVKDIHYWNYFDRNEVFDNEVSEQFGHLIADGRG